MKSKALEIRDGGTHRLRQIRCMEPCSLAAVDLGNPHVGNGSNRPSQSGLLECAPESQELCPGNWNLGVTGDLVSSCPLPGVLGGPEHLSIGKQL